MLLHTFVRRIAGVAMTAALAAGSALAHAATDADTVAQAVERMRVAMVASDGATLTTPAFHQPCTVAVTDALIVVLPHTRRASGFMKVKAFVTVTFTGSPECKVLAEVRSWQVGDAAGVTATVRSVPSCCTRDLMLFGAVQIVPVASWRSGKYCANCAPSRAPFLTRFQVA